MMLPVERALEFFERVELPQPFDDAAELVLGEIRTRLQYLCDVGLRYLTLDRQSRTLSGGEVQRINLTTALGTSLVNTLFVLDEPSIGLHPRDMGRVIEVMRRLKEAGNSQRVSIQIMARRNALPVASSKTVLGQCPQTPTATTWPTRVSFWRRSAWS